MEPLRPREYSIAGYNAKENELEFLIAMVQYETRLAVPRIGCLSEHFLVNRPEKVKIQLKNRPDSFPLPKSADTPLILIGPGTGLAPLRFMIQKQLSSENHLFFGCRGPDLDFYCQDELQNSKTLTRYLAFSRTEGHPHRYVQHSIASKPDVIKSLIERGAMIYLSGNSKTMPKDVSKTLDKILHPISSTDLKLNNRFIEETWS